MVGEVRGEEEVLTRYVLVNGEEVSSVWLLVSGCEAVSFQM